MKAGGAADARWMAAAIALSGRARPASHPNPNVGCVIAREGRVVGHGWTATGGRPHAEAMALAMAGDAARGAHAFVTLEPCAHDSPRGPSCAVSLIEAGIAQVSAAMLDPDPRTLGRGMAMLAAAGIACDVGTGADGARAAMAPWLCRQNLGRAQVTLKLATSLDGQIARADGESRWITGERARAHAHMLRARSDAILVGRGTLDADKPRLDVRLSGLEHRRPRRILLSRSTQAADDRFGGWEIAPSADAAAQLPGVHALLVEGGAGAAAAFIAADLVDTLILYRAPILLGRGRAALGDIGLTSLAAAHGRWQCADIRRLGDDIFERYERIRG